MLRKVAKGPNGENVVIAATGETGVAIAGAAVIVADAVAIADAADGIAGAAVIAGDAVATAETGVVIAANAVATGRNVASARKAHRNPTAGNVLKGTTMVAKAPTAVVREAKPNFPSVPE